MAEIEEINEALVALQEQLLALGTITGQMERNREAASRAIAAARDVVDTTAACASAIRALTARAETTVASLEGVDVRASLESVRSALGNVTGSMKAILDRMDALDLSIGSQVQRETSGLIVSQTEIRDDMRGGLLAMQSTAQEMQAVAASIEGRLLERVQVLGETQAREIAALAARMGTGIERLERQGKRQGILLIVAVILAAASAALHSFLR